MIIYNVCYILIKGRILIDSIIQFVLDTIEYLGYFGIFILMAIESSILPLPSEIVMIPAGYLAFQGKMNMVLAIMAGTFGSLAGALCNYYIAIKLGRIFVTKYGKYFFMKESSLEKTEKFFNRHGEISTFIGRLIPVVRHYISLPAGLARMSLARFCIFTLLGAGIWVSILSFFGYYLGVTFGDSSALNIEEIANAFGKGQKDSMQLGIKQDMRIIGIYTLLGVFIVGCVYVIWWKFFRKKDSKDV
ncbi:DedA family protein [Helicobacter saguini]|uniref:DedA family protein n=1 Tax=Helicobacter saguini TaxID=1548018 RepID=A0A347VID6_9HELI|nr:DedA family protein [Helicobacter saguini]MWV66672.1 DedA family protein [Helicobacter saguini]MWV69022.1 DedA family protein [Helicobacter saguini]MWV71424.1 DedA family protein [Helicobacter saguini]TLD94074.1 DedA family protein [Helicobacter saguini]